MQIPREPVTVAVDDLAQCHWETGKAQGRRKRKPGDLDHDERIRASWSKPITHIIGGMYG